MRRQSAGAPAMPRVKVVFDDEHKTNLAVKHIGGCAMPQKIRCALSTSKLRANMQECPPSVPKSRHKDIFDLGLEDKLTDWSDGIITGTI